MSNYDILIIGAGPAGLFSAISCAKKGFKVAILEKNKSVGRKLLITGGGKCNLTQDQPTGALINHYGTNTNFVKPSLYAFSGTDFRKFLHQNKLSTVAVENGKVFPQSMKATEVVNLLEKICHDKNVEILTETDVKRVTKNDGIFEVKTDNSTFYSKYLVVSTGGLSYPQTGSTGDGYIFAKNFGHKIRPTKFALAPLYIKNFDMAAFSGLSFEQISFSLWRTNKKIGEFSGDVLITHRGVSGPGIMDASRYMVRGDIIKLDFTAGSEAIEAKKNTLAGRFNAGGKSLVRSVVNDLNLPKRLTEHFLSTAGIGVDLKCAELSKASRTKLISLLVEYGMEIKEVGNANNAMVTAGGVDLKEVNPKTMESRKVEGLYFAGEVLDVDGDCGGYNIQAAVSMGYTVGQAIKNKI